MVQAPYIPPSNANTSNLYKRFIYKTQKITPKLTKKTLYPHHAKSALESGTFIKLSSIEIMKNLKNHLKKRGLDTEDTVYMVTSKYHNTHKNIQFVVHMYLPVFGI